MQNSEHMQSPFPAISCPLLNSKEPYNLAVIELAWIIYPFPHNFLHEKKNHMVLALVNLEKLIWIQTFA